LLIPNTKAPAFKVLNWANKRTKFLSRGQSSFSFYSLANSGHSAAQYTCTVPCTKRHPQTEYFAGVFV